MRGDFGRADPERGRFRDYVKTTLINLVINQRKKAGAGALLDAGRRSRPPIRLTSSIRTESS